MVGVQVVYKLLTIAPDKYEEKEFEKSFSIYGSKILTFPSDLYEQVWYWSLDSSELLDFTCNCNWYKKNKIGQI